MSENEFQSLERACMIDRELCVKETKPMEKWRILKNVVVIGVAFMVQFTAYGGAANLQSSINAEAGLGTASLAAVYVGLIFSNLFLTTLLNKWLGPKWTMSLSFATYMPYIAAQLWPTFYTMIPAALVVGLGGGPLWCAMSTYISVASSAYSRASNIGVDDVIVRFFGIFCMLLQMSQVWGSLLSAIVLSAGENAAARTSLNESSIPEVCGANFVPSLEAGRVLQEQPREKIQVLVVLSAGENAAARTSLNESSIPEVCGANFVPSLEAGRVLQEQPREKIQVLVGIYLICMAGAVTIIAVGVDSTKRFATIRRRSPLATRNLEEKRSDLWLLCATIKLLMEPNQLMFIIITAFVGLEQAFFAADFTAAYISCVIGSGTVGFVMLSYGITAAISCVVTGYLARVTGRLVLVSCAFILNAGILATMLLWRPQAHLSYILYVIAVLWAFCDSIWMVQLKAFSGILFPGREEAAYSNFHLWESVGYIIAYAMSSFLRTNTKTSFLFVIMIVGVLLYFVVEYRTRRTYNNILYSVRHSGK